ncbi:MAG: hypothetical protein E2O76_04400 [Caldithrix sp.]|nr:MAG: hypothetical protein E2O76_04400 [Caldithrix sp.]
MSLARPNDCTSRTPITTRPILRRAIVAKARAIGSETPASNRTPFTANSDVPRGRGSGTRQSTTNQASRSPCQINVIRLGWRDELESSGEAVRGSFISTSAIIDLTRDYHFNIRTFQSIKTRMGTGRGLTTPLTG